MRDIRGECGRWEGRLLTGRVASIAAALSVCATVALISLASQGFRFPTFKTQKEKQQAAGIGSSALILLVGTASLTDHLDKDYFWFLRGQVILLSPLLLGIPILWWVKKNAAPEDWAALTGKGDSFPWKSPVVRRGFVMFLSLFAVSVLVLNSLVELPL